MPNGISIGLTVYAQLTARNPYTLQWVASFGLKIAPSHGGSGPRLTWFLGPTRVLNPNGIWSGSAVFAELTSDSQADRPTDGQTTLLRL